MSDDDAELANCLRIMGAYMGGVSGKTCIEAAEAMERLDHVAQHAHPCSQSERYWRERSRILSVALFDAINAALDSRKGRRLNLERVEAWEAALKQGAL